MKILHLGDIVNKKYSGIDSVIPLYINCQSKYCDVYFVNLNNKSLLNLDSNKWCHLTLKQGLNSIKNEFKKPDLVVIHGIYNLRILIYYLLHIRNKHKYIAVPHGGLTKFSQKKSSNKKLLANFLFYKAYFKNALAVQFLSQDEKDNSFRFYKKSIIAGNGINIEKINNYKIKNRDEFKFIYVGRLEKNHKGLDLMLEAININRDFILDNKIKVYIYGIDYENTFEFLMNYIKVNKLDEIVFVNKEGIFGEEKKKVLLDSDFFIQTSRYEGLSLGVLEILSLGVPSILTKGVGMSNIINKYKCGFICENDAIDIANKMKSAYLLRKSDIKEMSNNAFEVAKQYNWSNVTEKTIKVYEEILYENNN